MNTKIIIALIAFCTTFGFSAGLTKLFLGEKSQPIFSVRKQTDERTRRRILNLLDSDIRHGQQRNAKIFSTSKNPFPDDSAFKIYSVATEEYVRKSASMYDDDLPQDFKTAWREHMEAWVNHSLFINDVETLNNSENTCLHNRSNNEISRTWYKALSIAARYNAHPANAY